jgi:hypothetical protein
MVYINISIRIPSDLLGSSVTTHPYLIPLSLKGRGSGEGDSSIRVRAWVLFALYSWMVTGFPDLNVFEYFFSIQQELYGNNSAIIGMRIRNYWS